MKVVVFGTRGIPNVLGGVETHCEMLYSAMAQQAKPEVTVICRSSYIPKEKRLNVYNGVQLKYIYAPKSKVFEAIIHSLLAALFVILKRPDIVHIHAIGPNLVAPLIRLFGLRVVMTHHGPDYQRQKWNAIPKFFLRLGEWCGVRFANRVIVISEQIKSHIFMKYGRADTDLIPNGVRFIPPSGKTDYLEQLNLKAYEYIFAAGRFVPEKGFTYLLEAFSKSGLNDRYKLVLAGDADHATPYSENLKKLAIDNGVVLTGFITGEPLHQLFVHTRLFVMPSFYEGLPITLLEAMSNKLNILASDIEANKEVGLPASCYFETGDTEVLAKRLSEVALRPYTPCSYNLERYDWNTIAAQTMGVYKSLMTGRRTVLSLAFKTNN